MGKSFIAVRDVEEETFKRFKMYAIEQHIKIGDALTTAMNTLLKQEHTKKLKNLDILLTIKPKNFGKGTEKLSEEVDNILYGK